MNIKLNKKDFSNVDYRFSYSLTINDLENEDNDIIIVKRDFNINNFDEESLYSIELKECIDDIVNIIKRDLKSKSRTYMWYNYDESYVTPEFSTPISDKQQSTFKFTIFDGDKAIITKIWSGDEYPFLVRNGVDLTNKKFSNAKHYELDFSRQVAQKGASERPDLTVMIIKHISSTCASFKNNRNSGKLMFKQHLPELKYEEIVIKDVETGKFSYVNNKLNYKFISSEDNRNSEKIVYDVYTTKYNVGDRQYDLDPENYYNEKNCFEKLKNFSNQKN